MNPNPMKPADELGPLDIREYANWTVRDLEYLQGTADATGNQGLANKIHGMRRNLRRLRLSIGDVPARDDGRDEK